MHSSNTRQLVRLSIETCGQCVVVVFVCVGWGWGGGGVWGGGGQGVCVEGGGHNAQQQHTTAGLTKR
jgi:hypothetical protein